MDPRLSYSDLFPAFLREVFRPGKQVFQEVQTGVVHVLRNLRQQMLQIFVDLRLVRLGCFHRAVDNSTGLRAVDVVNGVPVGSPNGKGTDRTLCCRIVNGGLLRSPGTLSDISPGSDCISSHSPVKIYAQIYLQAPGNRGVIQSRLQVLHVHVFLVAPLGARHMAQLLPLL